MVKPPKHCIQNISIVYLYFFLCGATKRNSDIIKDATWVGVAAAFGVCLYTSLRWHCVLFVFIGRAVSITRSPYGFHSLVLEARPLRRVGPPSVPYTEVVIFLTTFNACSPMSDFPISTKYPPVGNSLPTSIIASLSLVNASQGWQYG